MRLLVTGATGYIGERVVALARAAGHEVIAAGRRPLPGLPWHPFDLATRAGDPLPPGVDVVIHLAADTSGAGRDAMQAHELAAARQLLQAAQPTGARFVFVSSQTARADAPSTYGRTKWQIEQAVLDAGGVVVRPGQVYGGTRRALFGTLVGLVERLPLLPAFLPAPRIQPVHVDDLAQALVAVAQRPDARARVFGIGAAEPVSFTQFLRAIARHRVGRPRLFLPVPTVMMRVARRIGGGRIAALERLDSLFSLPLMDSAADLRELGLVLRPLEHGMPARARRPLLREGRVLLRYVLGQEPHPSLVRRQARAVERLRGGTAMPLPMIAFAFPATLSWVEDRAGSSLHAREFGWRLDCATAIAEASPQGARRFLGAGSGGSWIAAVAGLGAAVAAEVFWRATGLFMRPILRRR